MEEKQVTVKGGRKRKNLVKFYLNDEEYKKLCENVATFGRDKSKHRITQPYTEERKAMARAKMNEINNKEDNG